MSIDTINPKTVIDQLTYMYIIVYIYMALGPPFFAAEARVRAFSAFGVQEASFGVHPQCCGCHDVG